MASESVSAPLRQLPNALTLARFLAMAKRGKPREALPALPQGAERAPVYLCLGVEDAHREAARRAGWRLDVSGDASFPAGYWETFRQVTKATTPDALLISETWQKDGTLLRMIRGDRLDTTMNYRLRDAVLGLLAPQSFDSKGFADSGRIISPSEFASRCNS